MVPFEWWDVVPGVGLGPSHTDSVSLYSLARWWYTETTAGGDCVWRRQSTGTRVVAAQFQSIRQTVGRWLDQVHALLSTPFPDALLKLVGSYVLDINLE